MALSYTGSAAGRLRPYHCTINIRANIVAVNIVVTMPTVIVTANPLVVPGKPLAPVNTQRATELLVAGVNAIRG